MAGGIVSVNSAPEHGHRDPSGCEGAPVSLAVYATGKPADDHEARPRELTTQHPGDLSAVGGAAPGAHDRDRRA